MSQGSVVSGRPPVRMFELHKETLRTFRNDVRGVGQTAGGRQEGTDPTTQSTCGSGSNCCCCAGLAD